MMGLMGLIGLIGLIGLMGMIGLMGLMGWSGNEESQSFDWLYSCGGRTRTCDLQVMSLASYQLLHSAIFPTKKGGPLMSECKGTAFFANYQTFICFSS